MLKAAILISFFLSVASVFTKNYEAGCAFAWLTIIFMTRSKPQQQGEPKRTM